MTVRTMKSGGEIRQLFLEPALNEQLAEALLAPVGFEDQQAALQSLKRLANTTRVRRELELILPHLLSTLSNAAHPDRALINFERLINGLKEPTVLFRHLLEEPRMVELLVILFAGSQYLSETLLRNPQYFEEIIDRQQLAQPKSPEQFYKETLETLVVDHAPEEKLEALRRFHRRELLRIGAGDLFGSLDFQTVTSQLSHLADCMIQACLQIVSLQTGVSAGDFAVLALGKLGGQELNYSSDIDLLFVAASHEKKYQRLGEKLIAALTQKTGEGFLYRVDMRLRPWGSTGVLVPAFAEHLHYIQHHARIWEKQALLKARWVSGNEALGAQFLRESRNFLYHLPPAAVREEVRKMKTQIERTLHRRGRLWGEVKSGKGSIRDVEFITQHLQLIHGARLPEIRSRNTLNALARLTACGILSADDYRILADGYVFLRSAEHHLQIMHYQQTHLLPEDLRELAFLARRLGFEGEEIGRQFLERYHQHREAIHQLFQHYLSGEAHPPGGERVKSALAAPPAQDTRRHVSRMDAAYTDIFSEAEIKRHAALAEQLDDRNLVKVEVRKRSPRQSEVTVVGYDFFGELPIICGLFLVHGWNILKGHIFTYHAAPAHATPESAPVQRSGSRRLFPRRKQRSNSKRKIVDVFIVESFQEEVSPQFWEHYSEQLSTLLTRVRERKLKEVQGTLSKQVAIALRKYAPPVERLMPIDLEIDNIASNEYTVMRIDAPDTIGFLYLFTNALAISGIYISRMTISSLANRAHDTLFVTDAAGNKITDPEKQHHLRAATALLKHFAQLLPHSPNPESAMLNFGEFVTQLFSHRNWINDLASLRRPEVLDALATLLGVSDFLWNDFLRMQHNNLFPVVRDISALSSAKTAEMLSEELRRDLKKAPDFPARQKALNAFKDREIFRIDMRYILGLIPKFWMFSAELSDLAEVVVKMSCQLCNLQLCRQFGQPMLDHQTPCQLLVCALGKFGARGLGFASDIELMFIYQGAGKTRGPETITNAEYYEKLVQLFCKTIQAKREGIFEIDLRLRPYGRAGPLAVSLDSFGKYFAPGGAAWDYERQALVKLRPLSGNHKLARQVVQMRDQFLYTGKPFNVAAMRAMRERQIRQLVAGGTMNAKFSPGGLVDLEYLVEALQITHGHDKPRLRQTITGKAMEALAGEGILPTGDFENLRRAYSYLCRLIEALRVVRGNARDLNVPSANSEEFAFLARRLGYGDDVAALRDDLLGHTAYVREASKRLLG